MPAKKANEVEKITSNEWDAMVDALQATGVNGHSHNGTDSRKLSSESHIPLVCLFSEATF